MIDSLLMSLLLSILYLIYFYFLFPFASPSSSSFPGSDISFNMLEGLPAEAFKKLHHLYNLNLESNAITGLDEGIFFDLSSLEDLNLSYNQIKVRRRTRDGEREENKRGERRKGNK